MTAGQPVLTQAIVEKMGFTRNLVTLAKAVEISPHPILLDDLARFVGEGLDDPIWCDRQYLLANEIRLKHGSGTGRQLLVWTRTEERRRQGVPEAKPVTLVMAIDLFLLGEPKELKRFCHFIEDMSIQDTQAREWLAKHKDEIPLMALEPEGVALVVKALSRLVDGAETDLGIVARHAPRPGYEALAKEYRDALVGVRRSALVPALMVRQDPQHRLNLFRLLCHVEDPDNGPKGVLEFVQAIAAATGAPALVAQAGAIASAADFKALFNSVRDHLATPRRPLRSA